MYYERALYQLDHRTFDSPARLFIALAVEFIMAQDDPQRLLAENADPQLVDKLILHLTRHSRYVKIIYACQQGTTTTQFVVVGKTPHRINVLSLQPCRSKLIKLASVARDLTLRDMLTA